MNLFPVPASGAMQYVGCFVDSSNRVLKGKVSRGSHVSNEQCIKLCADQVRTKRNLQVKIWTTM